ncbi:spore cortex-lytic protein [Priestia megaterium]|uniref:cell wall hydrolase n=1 Tax=Priestia megaterium TaxID=1404 RepID=UPI00041CC640|nr:cell wall hydrolase [Priestia megaterium]ANF45283.1 spore cortex-lytic protein [Priestia megaterium]MCU7765163.1 cell wall hydrolase [Priestia megaterium]
MKHSYMKSMVVACLATLSFIGFNATATAATNYKVVKGDSLWKLGKRYSVTIDDIKKINNRQGDMIYIGETLAIPSETKVLAAETTEPSTAAPVNTVKPEAKPAEQETPAVSISASEKDLLARLVEAEAKGESYEGKVGVATVVLNRVDSPKFPDTVTGVIKQVVGKAYAFSPVQNGSINKPASEDSKKAVEQALTRKDRLDDSIYFYNPKTATDNWIRSRAVIKTIDHHVFAK